MKFIKMLSILAVVMFAIALPITTNAQTVDDYSLGASFCGPGSTEAVNCSNVGDCKITLITPA